MIKMLEVEPGENVWKVCSIAVDIARLEGVKVIFEFNGTPGIAKPDSTVLTTYTDWHIRRVIAGKADVVGKMPEGINL